MGEGKNLLKRADPETGREEFTGESVPPEVAAWEREKGPRAKGLGLTVWDQRYSHMELSCASDLNGLRLQP